MKEQARLISYYPHGFPTTRTPILLSRFSHLDTFKIPPLAFRHTTPALAYTSGKYSLPSAADARGQFGRRGISQVVWMPWRRGSRPVPPVTPGSLRIGSSVNHLRLILSQSADWHTVPGFSRNNRNRTRRAQISRDPLRWQALKRNETQGAPQYI